MKSQRSNSRPKNKIMNRVAMLIRTRTGLNTHFNYRSDRCLKAVMLATTLLLLVLASHLSNAATLSDDLIVDFNDNATSTAIQPDGKILVGGNFTEVNGSDARRRIIRLNVDGTIDDTFRSTVTGRVVSIVVLVDGKILVSGFFGVGINPTRRFNFARLNSDGSLDASFLGVANGVPFAISLQPDGKIVIGGIFSNVSDQVRTRIARLNSDGSLDPDFDPELRFDDVIRSISIESDGKLLVSGNFEQVNDLMQTSGMVRLNTDGSLDSNFNLNADDGVDISRVQPDGRIIISGSFENIDGVPRFRFARINADGSLDDTFAPNINSLVRAISLQPDNKILIAGDFTRVNDTPCSRVARLNSDGSLDDSFDCGIGPDRRVLTLISEASGNVIVAGEFAQVGDQERSSIARFLVPEAAEQSFEINDDQSAISWLRSGSGPVFSWTQLETSTDQVNWSSPIAGERIDGGWRFLEPVILTRSDNFIRLRGYYISNQFSSGSLLEATELIFSPDPNDCNFYSIPAKNNNTITICL